MIRAEVRVSWERALRAGVDRDRPRGLDTADDAQLGAARARSGLDQAWPAVARELTAVAKLDEHLIFLSDRTGRLLWVAGSNTARATAERVNLVPGARWDEAVVGTNGVGTVLRLGHPYQIRGREHYLRAVNGFTCSAAPIRDQTDGQILGVLDVTAPAHATNALTLTVVAQAARLAEAQLRTAQIDHDRRLLARFADRVAWHADRRVALVGSDGRVLRASPPGWLSRLEPPIDGGPKVTGDGQQIEVEPLAVGGPYVAVGVATEPSILRVVIADRSQASVTLGTSHRVLSRRHTELLRILLSNPAGLSAAELAERIYGDAGKVSTVRGEITRLRRVLGARVQADPYRVVGSIDADLGG